MNIKLSPNFKPIISGISMTGRGFLLCSSEAKIGCKQQENHYKLCSLNISNLNSKWHTVMLRLERGVLNEVKCCWSSPGLQTNQSQRAKMTTLWPSLPPAFPCLLCMYVLVCTGCFHIWSLSCVFLWAHSHALRILFPSLFLQTPLLLPKPLFPVRSRRNLAFPISLHVSWHPTCCFCEAWSGNVG